MMQNIVLFLAGIGLFLLAIYLIEDGLQSVTGRRFKLFLRKHTNNSLKAIASSTVITTILQSSSIVIMTILSFVGAGIVSLRNALAVTLGSNIGTTLANWIIVLLGFKMDISIVAYPLVAIGSASVALTSSKKIIHHIARLVLGFGIIFLGLIFMKESMTNVFEDFDFRKYEKYPPVVFAFIGFIMTALIQSSSATVAILLSALSTGSIPFEPAAAAVIGSELGTALKMIIGSIKGVAAKRQLAIGNLVFNVVISILALIFINPLVNLTSMVFAEEEYLMRLVLFQTSMNVLGVALFTPFIPRSAQLLEKYIRGAELPASFVIGKELLKEPVLASDALEQDAELLIHRILQLNLNAFATQSKLIHSPKSINATLHERNRKLRTYEESYEDIKKAEGEILIYALNLGAKYPEQRDRIEVVVNAVRHAMHSAKAMKDVRHNRIEFRETADDVKFHHYIDFRKHLETIYSDINRELNSKQHPSFKGLIDKALVHYHERRDKIYDAAIKEKLSSGDLSSLLNVNRELYTSCKTIVQALQLFYVSDARNSIGEIP